MKEISRRPMPTETAGITDIETFIHEGVKFAKLMTAADNGDVDAMIAKAFKDAIAECEYNGG